MLTFEQIKELIELVASHRMTGLELERSGFRLTIDGYPAPSAGDAAAPAPATTAPSAPVAVASAPAPQVTAPATAGSPEAADAASDGPPDGATIVTSPIIGTFYRSPNPEAPAFVDVGARVKKGQTLCIVEAMKLMNNIDSEVDGTVVEIYPKNGQAVEFGENLFAIQPD